MYDYIGKIIHQSKRWDTWKRKPEEVEILTYS
jgi:hypothetical protein